MCGGKCYSFSLFLGVNRTRPERNISFQFGSVWMGVCKSNTRLQKQNKMSDLAGGAGVVGGERDA